MSELKPCLGCQKPAAEIEFQRGKFNREEGFPDGWRVRCAVCALQTCWWHSESEAIEHWNTRPTDDKVARLVEALKPFAKFACDEPCHCNNCIARNEIDRIQAESEVGE